MDAAKLAAAMRSTGTFYGTPEGAGALCPAWLQSDPDDDASGTLRHYLRLQEVTREFYRGAIDEDEHRDATRRVPGAPIDVHSEVGCARAVACQKVQITWTMN